MEDYVARDDRPLEACLADVERCDIYVGVVAWHYGFVPQHDNPGELSITELEYRRARELNKPCLIFLLADYAAWPRSHVDTELGLERVERFRNKLLRDHVVGFFESADDLAVQVATALVNWERSEQEREPTVKKPPPQIFLSYRANA